jgi:hypothetical protein
VVGANETAGAGGGTRVAVPVEAPGDRSISIGQLY